MMAIFMVIIALLIDGTQFLLGLLVIGLVLNWIVSFFAWLTYYIWLKILGISMSDAKGMKIMLSLGTAMGIELIPLVNMFPAWAAFAILTIMFEYAAQAKVIGKTLKTASALTKPAKA
ncbi:MAG: hypothetical protein UW30_C0004G0031 [Candidatus Giovannonibacteria bacterium GW2011_GWA2_44_13b]|uniref:Uncharacterized protein n=1 Tax=Candidatus Giovannonibacteria bacterium GW2011_GWA2_44_13b TaxID=1618647 RepID=A0A0G1JCS5_9BACT|nr:MAG: hypothetical protein UW30_C0004G0031 [Candidatus Giovannonibacteria bacterium GW2011_GWA2_44_13b]